MIESYTYIELNGKSDTPLIVPLGENVITLVTRYNYSAKLWCMDILDTQDSPMVLGIMLVPGFDLLEGLPHLQTVLGSFVVVEKERGDHKNPELLSTNVRLLWFPPTEEVVIPQ